MQNINFNYLEGVKSDFKFKGNRNYLHGTDFVDFIFPKILENKINDLGFIKFKFKNKCNKNIFISSRNFNQNKFAEIILKDKHSNLKYNLNAYEILDNYISKNYNFNEKNIYQQSIINKLSLSSKFKINKKFSIIENIVSNTKFLHLKVYGLKSKWYFVEIKYIFSGLNKIKKSNVFKINIISNTANKITQTKLTQDEIQIALINFFRYE